MSAEILSRTAAPSRSARTWRLLFGALAALAVLAAGCTADPLAQAGGQPEPAAPVTDASASETPSDPAAPSSPTPEPAPAPEPTPAPAPAPSAEPASPSPVPEPVATPPPTTALAGTEGLAQGAAGEPVVRLQQRLNQAGYAAGAADGAFGARTALAVRAFQSDHGLGVSGQVDGGTVAALEAAPPGEILGPGSTGEAVRALQQQLNDGPFDAGTPDGEYGTRTMEAVYALQKLYSAPVSGQFSAVERHLLASGQGLRPRALTGAEGQQGTQVEIDVAAQLVRVYTNGQLVLASHTSTASGETFCTPAGGCRRAVTPSGSYTITRRIDGWREAELGRLYNPLYFNGGIALHGSNSVPTHPASHGCVRLPMHIAEYAPDLLPNGTPVIVT